MTWTRQNKQSSCRQISIALTYKILKKKKALKNNINGTSIEEPLKKLKYRFDWFLYNVFLVTIISTLSLVLLNHFDDFSIILKCRKS